MNREFAPVLFVGGTGVVGSAIADHVKRRNPQLQVVLTSRQHATPIQDFPVLAADTSRPGLGIALDRDFSAIVNTAPDPSHHVQRFAADRGTPLISLIGGPHSMAQELTVHSAAREPGIFVHAGHWAAGIVSALSLEASRLLRTVRSATVVVSLDPQDRLGPAALDEDYWNELLASHPLPLTAADGRWSWTRKHASSRLRFTSVSGEPAVAEELSTSDVLSLGEALRPARVRFAGADEDSSGTLIGADATHDVVVELTGENRYGATTTHRLEVQHPGGLRDLTGLATSLLVERVLGLARSMPPRPGFYDALSLLRSVPVLPFLREQGTRITREVSPAELTRG